MRYLSETTFELVIAEWANREHKTEEELRRDRAYLIDALPREVRWTRVRVFKNDLKKLQVINEPASWNILSGWKGSIDLVVKNYCLFSQNPPSIPNILIAPGKSWPQYFADRLDGLRRHRQQAGFPENNLCLILISSSQNGPFTILEGNHTAVALYFRHFIDHPEIRYRSHICYLGICPSMRQCNWYHQNSYT